MTHVPFPSLPTNLFSLLPSSLPVRSSPPKATSAAGRDPPRGQARPRLLLPIEGRVSYSPSAGRSHAPHRHRHGHRRASSPRLRVGSPDGGGCRDSSRVSSATRRLSWLPAGSSALELHSSAGGTGEGSRLEGDLVGRSRRGREAVEARALAMARCGEVRRGASRLNHGVALRRTAFGARRRSAPPAAAIFVAAPAGAVVVTRAAPAACDLEDRRDPRSLAAAKTDEICGVRLRSGREIGDFLFGDPVCVAESICVGPALLLQMLIF